MTLSDPHPELVAALAARRAELLEQVTRLTAPAAEPEVTLGFGKRAGDFTALATERTERVVTAERLEEQLSAVERAGAKLAEGSYGSCDACGADIGDDRLAALPAAALCLSCKREDPRRESRA